LSILKVDVMDAHYKMFGRGEQVGEEVKGEAWLEKGIFEDLEVSSVCVRLPRIGSG